MGISRQLPQVSTSAGMVLLLWTAIALINTAQSQEPEGYFNGSSFASVHTALNINARTSLSFRTCSGGQLLYQESSNGDSIDLSLLPSGRLVLRWQINRNLHSASVESNLINNQWHDVDIIHRLGSVTFGVDGRTVLIANSTYQSDLFDLRFESLQPQLIVGRGFTGCILQGAGVVLNESSTYSSGVIWGKCPLPNRGDCVGYQTDHCFSQPCHKFSKCMSTQVDYHCACTTRYTGRNCDIDLGPLCDKPEHNQCQNGGVCQEDKTGNSTICACLPNFTGAHCETRIDNTFCDSKPCRNGGTCNINQFQNSYVCTCPQGFAGVDCELNIDECQQSPCQNNGSCTDEINSYTCDCTGTGYRGPNCEININECEENNPCYTGSKCFDRYGSYICDCPQGFDGKNCDQEVNECDSSPCLNAGSCIDNLNGYLCNCVPGFAGINCEENIDDCSGITCPNNSRCVDGVNSFSCVCNPGYSGAVPHCYEIDECAEGPCLNGGICHDQLNGFTCACLEGFVGRHCEVDINECNSNPCHNGATCIDSAGKYICSCAPGYSGINCDENVNDCEPNPCVNGHCADLVNDYHCECLPGWEGKNCVDNVNECVSQPCMHGQCVDLLNNFTCACEPGYSGKLCENDINECDSSPCFNGGTCTDLVNDFLCACRAEFMGKTCSEVYDACRSSPCMNKGICHTSVPSHSYTCSCIPGYLGDDCEIDVDDCAGIVCPTGQICFDKENAYECRCPVGFSGSDCSVNINECSSNPCRNGTCIDGIGNYTCQCPPGLMGKHCENDIDECTDSPCAHGICQNLFGSYRCYCTPGFTGTHCDIEFNECLSMPCKNNATCNDLINNYSCTCVSGFTGRNCETDINECASDPCQNGARCNNLINKYECTCLVGFSGQNCEVNIDECASQPCLNSGACIDLINDFTCNCTNSGFSGTYCEVNIDDCSPNPCQNGAECHDLIKDYRCDCYSGYKGKNCEIDVPECASSPCINSDECLENSNQTLYNMNYLGLFPTFSYASAGGYKCICSSGFTGENCETNIDDCEHNMCENSICIDGINDYYCACHLGYDGQFCKREIDECGLQPCKNGAQCIDLVADYRCKCLPNFGGKSCETPLIGCNNVQCANGGTCVPRLSINGEHGYTCLCPQGFYGESCEMATTTSFNGHGLWSVTQYNMLSDSLEISFRFRTTISDGLISEGYISSPWLEYRLYLWSGTLRLDVYNATDRIAELFSNIRQNDSFWKSVQLNFEPSKMTLNVSGMQLQKDVNFSTLNMTLQFGSQPLHYTPTFNDNHIPNFIGCIQDVFVNGEIIIPRQNSELDGAIEGCPRTEQCKDSPCNGGFCKDNWLSFECVCSRPYFGNTCQYSYEPATFGFKDRKSSASLVIPGQIQARSDLSVTYLLRTRKSSGSIFYLGTSLNGQSNCSTQEIVNETFMLARLVDGNLQVIMKLQNGDIKEVTLNKRLDDGDYYFIQVVKNATMISLKANDTKINDLIPDSPFCEEMLYIAGLPEASRQKRQLSPIHEIDLLLLDNITFFKGIIQDFRINDMVVVFYDLNAVQDETFPKIIGKADMSETVQRGVVSDDPCNILQPCLHNSVCKDAWNDYVCLCPDDYRGKNCEERKPCSNNACPSDSECRNLDVGYECVASAAFDGKMNGIQYMAQNINHDIDNITFSFRSQSNGTILWIEGNHNQGMPKHFFHVEFTSGRLEAMWDLGPSHENTTLLKTVSKAVEEDYGQWRDVTIKFDGNLINLTVSGFGENLSEDNYAVSLRDLLNGGGSVYVAYRPDYSNYFKGCLKDVRIGGMLLSFVDSTLLPMSSSSFQVVNAPKIELGCTLCWDDDCIHGTCINKTFSYDCDCYSGYEGQHCDKDMCNTQNPCVNGLCYHDNYNYNIMCSCPKEFTGANCSQRNHCVSSPCQNGGRCSPQPEIDDYACECQDNYEGKNCEYLSIVDCNSFPCKYGECMDVPGVQAIRYKCRCYEGYDGMTCNDTKDFCGNNPCQNNGICEVFKWPYFANYTCTCQDGFTGINCETNIDECENNPCEHGKCTDGINAFTCDCYPGYKGLMCNEKIEHCNSVPNVCYFGTCHNATNGYHCKCEDGYFGEHCSVWDECDSLKCNDRGTCHPSHDETGLLFQPRCACVDGYSGFDCSEKLAISGGEDETNLILIILIPVMSLFILCLLIGAVIFLRIAKKKRATRGTYSPSRQEMFGSRVEMNHVMKPPPEERLI